MATKPKPWTYKTTRAFSRGTRVPTETGFTTRYTNVPCDVVVEVDWAELVKFLGAKALKSKSGKAQALHGAVIVRAKAIVLPSEKA